MKNINFREKPYECMQIHCTGLHFYSSILAESIQIT